MTKNLITLLGIIASLGVVALGFFLVALPILMQAVSVNSQTATVANTNTVYQAQVDALNAQAENLDEIQADVTALRKQIPAVGQYDDVFEVIARAATESGVQLTNVSAGVPTVFAMRGGGDAALAATPAPEATADATADGTDATAVEPPVAASPREQVDFAISATAADMAQATEFIDALRAGPRLLNSVTAATAAGGEGGITVTVSALTYIDGEG